MIAIEEIEHIVRLCILSTAIKDEKPVSLLLAAPPEHGKTEALKKFSEVKGVHFATNFDGAAFLSMAKQIESNEIKTLIIPDFLRITMRRASTTANSITILNALTEEGWSGNLPFGGMISKPLHCNVLTALTMEALTDRRHKWARMGFLSRFLPISYSYSETTKEIIRSYIRSRQYSNEETYKVNVKQPIKVILPSNYARDLQNLTLELLDETNYTGFRLQRQLQVLTMAQALHSKRTEVIEDDIKVIQNLAKWVNFKFAKV